MKETLSMIKQLESDMKEALKAGNRTKANFIRLLIAKCKNKSIELGRELEDSETIKVLQNSAKQLKDSLKLYLDGGREDLVDQAKVELSCIESYLPKMLSEEDTKLIISEIIEETGATSLQDLGRVMPVLMKKGQGKIDGKMAQEILRSILS